MKISTLVLAALCLMLNTAFAEAADSKTTSLFNGKDLTGWHVDVPDADDKPDAEPTFIVRDGLLVSLGQPKGHLITDAKHANYRLEVEYRFAAKPGNCGVLVHASTPRALYKMFPKSIEVQMNHQHAGDFWCIVEDITVPNMVERRGPKEKWGITEGKARRILNLTDDSEKPVGEWNSMVIECLGDQVKVWVNGDFVNHGSKCTASKGQIALQAEGSEVEFRKLDLTPITKLTANAGTTGVGNFVVGPDYKVDPDLTDRGNPKGKSFEFSMRLADSKIFPGTDMTLDPKKEVRKERKIFVYIPAAYKDGTKAPILVTLDGPSRLDLVRNALDNLTISKDPSRKLPAFIAIAVQNGGSDSYGSERGLEYDTMSDRFARFINDEVLPAVLNNAKIKAAYPNIAFTEDPEGKGVMGCSSGGAAALTMGWFRPDLFRRLITYSGTFVDQQDDDAPEEEKYPLGAWEYHSSMKLIENSEKKPLRIFTHVSENDNRANDPESTYHNWVMANQRTAEALKAKGYDYRFIFSKATRHCDSKVYELTLADTLVWMWQGYSPE